MKETLTIVSKWYIKDVLDHHPSLTKLQASRVLEKMRKPLETFIMKEGWAVISDCIDEIVERLD